MISDQIREEILLRLQRVEREHEVRILYAVESGSRARGFASPGSRHDVRFIHVHPLEWYLSVDLEERRDVIECETADGIGINGWDLRKALQLFRASDPAFVEWLQSPVVYRDDGLFAERVRALLPEVHDMEKGVRHYLKRANDNYQGYVKAQLVPLDKYFSVLQPLLAIRWLERYRSPPPMEFELLCELVADNTQVYKAITRLLARKRTSQEKDFVPVVNGLNEFIENELSRFSRYTSPEQAHDIDVARLNSLFRECLVPASDH